MYPRGISSDTFRSEIRLVEKFQRQGVSHIQAIHVPVNLYLPKNIYIYTPGENDV